MNEQLTSLEPGMAIPWGGTHVARVSAELAEAFEPGDSLIALQHSGELLHLPAAAVQTASIAVGRAVDAFAAMGSVSDEQITSFYTHFADALANDVTFGPITDANAQDVAFARERGRVTGDAADLCGRRAGLRRRDSRGTAGAGVPEVGGRAARAAAMSRTS